MEKIDKAIAAAQELRQTYKERRHSKGDTTPDGKVSLVYVELRGKELAMIDILDKLYDIKAGWNE